MSPGEWAGLVCLVGIACLIWLIGGDDPPAEDEVDPGVAAMRAETEHPSERIIKTDPDEFENLGSDETMRVLEQKPFDIEAFMAKPLSPEFERLMFLTRVAATGHATDDEKRELHELRIRYGRFEEVVQV